MRTKKSVIIKTLKQQILLNKKIKFKVKLLNITRRRRLKTNLQSSLGYLKGLIRLDLISLKTFKRNDYNSKLVNFKYNLKLGPKLQKSTNPNGLARQSLMFSSYNSSNRYSCNGKHLRNSLVGSKYICDYNSDSFAPKGTLQGLIFYQHSYICILNSLDSALGHSSVSSSLELSNKQGLYKSVIDLTNLLK